MLPGVGISVYWLISNIVGFFTSLFGIILTNVYDCKALKAFFVAHGEDPDKFDNYCRRLYNGEIMPTTTTDPKKLNESFAKNIF